MNGKNLYILIYNYLLTRIHYDFYPKGEPLPSILNLSNLFDVSTMAVRGALELLQENGYLAHDNKGRSIIQFDPEHPVHEFPSNILVQEKALRDIHQSFDLIFPSVFFRGLSLCTSQELKELSQILKRSLYAWNEPLIDFLAHIVKYLKNPLLVDLYYDVMLFCYPSYLAHVASDQEQWIASYDIIHKNLENILLLKRNGNDTALWDVIKQTYPHFASQIDSYNQDIQVSTYHWGKSQVCQSVACKILTRIYAGIYPEDTFLPSPNILAKEFSTAVITLRRAIVLLNNLGAVESINGKGTKVISSKKGVKNVKWNAPTVSKNILLYLESLHILTITCRLLAISLFPLLSLQQKDQLKEKIQVNHHKIQVGLSNIICLKTLVDASNLPSLKVIYNKLFGLMIGGQPLSYLQPPLRLDHFTKKLVASLDSKDAAKFGDTLEQSYAAIFLSSKRKALSMGMKEAEALTLPFTVPDIQDK